MAVIRRHRKRCEHCQEMYLAARKHIRFCTSKCALLSRGIEWFRAHQNRLTALNRARGFTALERRLKGHGFTDEQIAIVRRERNAARGQAYESGRRRGWAQALGERGDFEGGRPRKVA